MSVHDDSKALTVEGARILVGQHLPTLAALEKLRSALCEEVLVNDEYLLTSGQVSQAFLRLLTDDPISLQLALIDQLIGLRRLFERPAYPSANMGTGDDIHPEC